MKTVEQGAGPTVRPATTTGPAAPGAEDRDIAEPTPGDSQPRPPRAPWACDPESAERLWVMGERLSEGRIQA
jgi:hypothetical protein